MAANKFATMLHRNTNKMTLILIYAVLEWILIILLLLNSLFSYLIIKFANYFGLKPPCPWCSRVDHILEPAKNKNTYRDLLCEAHAVEISKLGYCLNHRKLSESEDMCEDCSSSRSDLPKNLTLFPWMKQVGLIQDGGERMEENGQVGLSCSCCGVNLTDKILSPYIVIKPSWGVLDYTQKGDLAADAGEDDNSDEIRSDFESDCCENGVLGENRGGDGSLSEPEFGLNEIEIDAEVNTEDNSIKIMGDPSSSPPETRHQDLEFFFDFSGHRLVPVEVIDLKTEEDQSRDRVMEESQEKSEDEPPSPVHELQHVDIGEERDAMAAPVPEREEDAKVSVLQSVEIEEDENSLVIHAKEYHLAREMNQSMSQDTEHSQPTMTVQAEEDEQKETGDFPPELPQFPSDETQGDVSVGTEIDLVSTDDVQAQEPFTSPTNLQAKNDQDSKKPEQEKETVEFKNLAVEEITESSMNNQMTWSSELNETEEDKVPDTPTSLDSLHNLHKKLLLLEKRESGAEESLDGSVISELEGSDGVVTVERLKSALRSEKKALQLLYKELEEERSASAVAANQTMAMINRLQEEKAAMQMEALQYQRMMEEQSEYDQEALQLLNELMVKREKEKQELEKELEVYRRRVLDYEAKEQMRVVLRRSKDSSTRSGFSSASCSNAEDSDGLSIDLNQETKEEDGFFTQPEGGNNHNTPVDAVINLEESLADFEEERQSILEQLKVLEQKLFTLDDEDGKQSFEDVRPMIQDFHGENGNGNEHGMVANGFGDENHHQERKIFGSKGKKLLPLFDAMNMENGDGELNNVHENGHGCDLFNDSNHSGSDLDTKKVAIEEEVDHLYERLQALEADREFLKHCISSLKKGDKGMDLLHEILQHLRDLRNVELRVRNLGDGVVL